MKKKKFVVNRQDIKVKRVYNIINILLKYNYYLYSINNEANKVLGLQNVEKY